MEDKQTGRRSGWIWLLFGCGGCLTAILIAGIVAVVAGVGFVREVERNVKDLPQREAKVLELLGTEQIPEGYHPMLALEIPFLVRLAMLSDRPPKADGEPQGFDRKGFIYIDVITASTRDARLIEDFFSGRTDSLDPLREHDIKIEVEDVITRGSLEHEGQRIRYVAERGRIAIASDSSTGLATLMMVDCPRDSRLRIGIWFEPDPSPDTPIDELDLTGTIADEDEIRGFLGQFRLCR